MEFHNKNVSRNRKRIESEMAYFYGQSFIPNVTKVSLKVGCVILEKALSTSIKAQIYSILDVHNLKCIELYIYFISFWSKSFI